MAPPTQNAPPAPPGADSLDGLGVSARLLARRHTAAAIATLAALLDPAVSERGRLAAALALIDRGWGKVGIGSEEDEGGEDGADPEQARDRLAERIERLAAAIDGVAEVREVEEAQQ